MEIVLNSYDDLLDFIKRDEVPAEAAAEIVKKFLNVIILYNYNKENLIKATEVYIVSIRNSKSWEQPIFLDFIGDVV